MKHKIIKIAIVDDHTLLRDGLVKIISEMKNVKIEILATGGEDLLPQLSTAAESPDVVLLSVSIPLIINSFQTMNALSRDYPSVRILVLSMQGNEYTMLNMIRHGAKGYLEKSCGVEDLAKALHAVYRGNFYLSLGNLGKVRLRIRNGLPEKGITPREMEFLGHCCSDLTYQEIGERMFVSVRTIHGYRDALFGKLKLRTRTGLVLFALNAGVNAGSASLATGR